MRCRVVQTITLCLVFGGSSCLAPPNVALHWSTRRTNRNKSYTRQKSKGKILGTNGNNDCGDSSNDFIASTSSASSSSSRSGTNSNHDDGGADAEADGTIIVMDWECLVDTLPYYTQLGIDAARTVWPHLNDLCDSNDLGWVENKLAGISHVLSPPPPSLPSMLGTDRHHPACEYALAARLILEEQTLDQNQTSGKSGKYARRFHPRGELPLSNGPGVAGGDIAGDGDGDSASMSSKADRPAVSTRPLTVGELAANWRDSIRATLPVRYHCNYKDPLPVLDATIQGLIANQQRLARTSEHQPTSVAQLFPETKFALSNTVRKVLIQTRQVSDVQCLVQCFESSGSGNGIRFQIASSVEEALSCNGNLGVVVLRQEDPTPSSGRGDTVRRVLQSDAHCPAGTTVTYVDSSWHRLQESIELFGDSIPRHGSNKAKCVVPGRFLSLYLAEWPRMVHPEESRNAAILNPWADTLPWQRAEALLVPPWSGSTFQ